MRWKALICGEKEDVQAGRIILWGAVVILFVHWISPFFLEEPVKIPESLIQVFYSLLMYNGFKHARYAYERVTSYNKTGGKDE